MQQMKERSIISNSKVRDSGAKLIFGDAMLCAQFIRDYIDLPYMKDVQPEDIEDVSSQFVPLFEAERNADRVKRIQIQGKKPFFIISLIEHKTDVEYDVCMQIFRYMIYIWEDYAKEEEKRCKGITHRKDFKYPPILPIVYYEGKDTWTAPLNFHSRVEHGDVFGKYIPDFQYYLVPIRDYSTEELLKKTDEISLIMLINKVQMQADMEELSKIPEDVLREILRDTPTPVIDLISDVLLALLLKANVPVEEAEELVGKVKEKKMAELFANAKVQWYSDENLQRIMELREVRDELRMQVEEEKQLVEEQRLLVEEERQKAEEQRLLVEEERQKAREQAIKAEKRLESITDKLREQLGWDEERINNLLQ